MKKAPTRTLDPRLAEIYAAIPTIKCRGLCIEACSVIPVQKVELVQIRAAASRRVRTTASNLKDGMYEGFIILKPDGLSCPLLKKKRCTIYQNRPLICRLFGVARGLECPYGCLPERFMDRAEVAALLERLNVLT